MIWGIPPKLTYTHLFFSPHHEALEKIKTVIQSANYDILEESSYTISAKKKMKLNFFGILTMNRAYVTVFFTVTKKGEMTAKSTYDYHSRTGIAFCDSGRLKKESDSILSELKI